jgi:hypothetical protein
VAIKRNRLRVCIVPLPRRVRVVRAAAPATALRVPLHLRVLGVRPRHVLQVDSRFRDMRFAELRDGLAHSMRYVHVDNSNKHKPTSTEEVRQLPTNLNKQSQQRQ